MGKDNSSQFRSQRFSCKKSNHSRRERSGQRKTVGKKEEGKRKRGKEAGREQRNSDFTISWETGVIALWNCNSIDWIERVFGAMWDDLDRCACSLVKVSFQPWEGTQLTLTPLLNSDKIVSTSSRAHSSVVFAKGKGSPSAPWSVLFWESLPQQSFLDSVGFLVMS